MVLPAPPGTFNPLAPLVGRPTPLTAPACCGPDGISDLRCWLSQGGARIGPRSDFLPLFDLNATRSQRRELFRNTRVLYLYHNRIDATGDKPGTELVAVSGRVAVLDANIL